MTNQIIITGASSSIGKNIISKLNKSKNFLFCQTNKNYIIKKKKILHYSSDFNKTKSIKKFIRWILKKNKKINTIIHLPASKISLKKFTEFSWDEIQNQINIQVRSLHLLILGIFNKNMFNKNAKIIIVGSEVTRITPPKGMLDYVCAKALLQYYYLAIKNELINTKIKVIFIRPTMFESPLLSHLPNYFIKKYSSDKSKKILNSITSKIIHLINNNSDFKKNFIDIK